MTARAAENHQIVLTSRAPALARLAYCFNRLLKNSRPRHCEEAEGRRGNPESKEFVLFSGSPRPLRDLATTVYRLFQQSVKFVAIASAFAAAGCFSAAAEDLAAFYHNKQIRFVVSSEPGGGYDIYTRLIARHLQKYIPGNPQVVAENMPGGSGHTEANWLYNVAPKDGTVIGMIFSSMPADQVLGVPGVYFDSEKFNWLGNPLVDNLLTVISSSAGISSLADLTDGKHHLFCGDSGGSTLTFPLVVNRMLNTDIKIISGYPGLASVYLAMDRGEANCVGGTPWASLKSTRGAQLKNRQFNLILEWGTNPDPEIASYIGHDIPMSSEIAKTDLDRQAIAIVNANSTIGKPLVAPPGLPEDRVAALRQAFDEVMKDPELLADAKKADIDVKPLAGIEVQKLATGIVHSSPEVVQRLRELVTP